MKKEERILLKVTEAKLMSHRTGEPVPVEPEVFIEFAHRYIKAAKQCRLVCSVGWINATNTARDFVFKEFQPKSKNTNAGLFHFGLLFDVFGYKQSPRRQGYFHHGSCGVDICHDPHYRICHKLKSLGFLSKKQCDDLVNSGEPHLI